MSLTYITGISASGKSSVMRKLQELGFEAHGVDEEGYANWVDRETGETRTFHEDDPSSNIHDWYQKHHWILSRDRIRELKDHSDRAGKTIILAEYADDEDNVRQLFDKVIYLAVDEDTIRERVNNRQDNHFGKTGEEMAAIVEWLDKNDEAYRKSGAYVIDAAQSLNKVMKEVLKAISV